MNKGTQLQNIFQTKGLYFNEHIKTLYMRTFRGNSGLSVGVGRAVQNTED